MDLRVDGRVLYRDNADGLYSGLARQAGSGGERAEATVSDRFTPSLRADGRVLVIAPGANDPGRDRKIGLSPAFGCRRGCRCASYRDCRLRACPDDVPSNLGWNADSPGRSAGRHTGVLALL